MPAITIEKALRKYNSKFYKSSLDDNLLNEFWAAYTKYKHDINVAIGNNESEEHLKNINNDFIKKIYKDPKYSVNTDKRIDSSIKVDNHVRVIIETKKPSNKAEMITEKKLNVKALHEVINYYLVETRDVSGTKVRRFPDVEIRRCIITDTQSWAIFDANSIEKIVDGYLEKLFFKYKNNQLVYKNNNDKFYKDIKEYLKQISIEKSLQYAGAILEKMIRYPGTKKIICNRNNNINYEQILANGEIVFMCTRRGDLGPAMHSAFGTFFIILMQNAVLRRPGNESNRIPHFLYIDEFPEFISKATEPIFTF